MASDAEKFDYYLKSLCFFIISIAHPIIFFIFLFKTANGSFGKQAISILGQMTFIEVSTNVYRINLLLFIPFAMALNALSIFIQGKIIALFRKNFSLLKFTYTKLGTAPLVVSIFGSLNLLFWFFGMEGNVFAFLFGLPMLILSIISFSIFIAHIVKAIKGRYDA